MKETAAAGGLFGSQKKDINNMPTKKTNSQPSYSEKFLSTTEIETGIRLLTKRRDDLKELLEQSPAFDSAHVAKAQTKLKETLTTIYGPTSRRVAEIPNLKNPVWHYMAEDEELQNDFKEQLPKAIGWVESHIESLEEQLEEESPTKSDSESLWTLVHPTIVNLCKKKFEDHHYADSVETAFKAVNERVKMHVKKQSGKELDGTSLMQQAFSPNSPIIVLADQSTLSGKDEQAGYMAIYAGAMQGVRNPKAHGNLTITSKRAMHLLFLASLLMHRLDDASVA